MATATPNSDATTLKSSPSRRSISFLGGKVKNFTLSSLRITAKTVGLVTAVNLTWYFYQKHTVNEFFGEDFTTITDEDGKEAQKPKKRVLVLPLDSLKLVEERKSSGFNDVLQKQRSKQPTIVLEMKELVDVIHAAAGDPNVTALYADFGEGMRYPLDYAHIEEVRNAIRIFNESHRVHRSPNVEHNPVFAMPRNGDPKLSFAFGHNFGWREYFLASAFSNVYLQPRGHLDLGGSVVSNVFFRGMLDKYGIKAHVFKHGDFKTATNSFSERGYTKSHLDSVKSITTSFDDTIRSSIQNSRSLKFDQVMWKSIHDYGFLTAPNAKEIGLVTSLPPVTPLSFMIKANNDAKAKAKLEEKFGVEICSSTFNSTDMVSLIQYKQMLDKRTQLEKIHSTINNYLHRMSELSTATSLILSGLGIKPSKPNEDKIAVVTVDGNIASSLSFRVIQSIRKIREDKKVKCLVLRVNSGGGSVVSSEAILEELKTLDVPVICSMGNYAASGGYYIATNSKRIFAQPTTLTGSIGVFLVKFDASNWAKSYGVYSDYHPRGNHSAAPSPFVPLTPGMKGNLERLSLGFYDYFKSIVANARSFTAEEVENIAQGRVWTGEQAKEVGLVDELGGLDRAISYAKSNFTECDSVSIEHWPKNTFSFADLPDMLLDSKSDTVFTALQALFSNGTCDQTSLDSILSNLAGQPIVGKTHFMLAMDEKTAIELIVMGE